MTSPQSTPSRYALPDVLGREAWSRFGTTAPGYRRAQAICDYTFNHLKVPVRQQHAAVDSRKRACSGYVVCRDFTHLAISLCRALSIPARYVFGYLPEIEVHRDHPVMDLAAWMEVYLGDRWWTFDPPRTSRARAGC